MKKVCCLLLCASLAGTGCVTLPPLWPENKPAPAAPAVVTTAAPVQLTVSPEQISDANAKSMAAALQTELDQDTHPAAGFVPAPSKLAEEGKRP